MHVPVLGPVRRASPHARMARARGVCTQVLVQKSGYYARAAPSNKEDLKLIKSTCEKAVQAAVARESGVVALDEDQGDVMRCIEFPRIKGGKPFNTGVEWFKTMLSEIGQGEAYPVQ